MKQKILFIRTYIPSGMGGPLPPIELLSLASFIRKKSAAVEVRIIDTGLFSGSALDGVAGVLASFEPDVVYCGSLLWEAGLVHAIAAAARRSARPPFFIVSGQMAALLGEDLLRDPGIDCGIIGDGEETLTELLAVRSDRDIAGVRGIVCRKDGVPVATPAREPLRNLDETAIDPDTWSLIDFRAYSRDQGWNGALAEDAYLPVMTSRGCPFGCSYCGIPATAGRTFRPRSAASVVAELAALHRAFGVREFHVFDPAFNADPARAADVCRSIIAARLPVRLAFPHGLRADRMNDELIGLLREAGTYKIVYGIETASPRLQAAIGKKLDLERTRATIAATARTGIITGGYFMLGLSTETVEEMRMTIAYAAASELDVAAFFKCLDYDEFRRAYREWWDGGAVGDPFTSFTYFSRDRGAGTLPAATLNALLFEAQRSFYLRPRRLGRLWRTSPSKLRFLGNLAGAAGALLASYLLVAAARGQGRKPDGIGGEKT
jgi:hypothetical protein